MKKLQTRIEEIAYDTTWFEHRAQESLKEIAGGTWDYSDSLLLYLPGFDEIYEEVQDKENPYYKLVTAPERQYLEEIASEIVRQLPENFEYIDLGPGTEHKEQFIFVEAWKQNKPFSYSPVDISKRYLELAGQHATKQGISVQSLRLPFENVPSHLNSDPGRRFVSLGLTYSNYVPEEAFGLLKEIAGVGKIFINSQIRERINTQLLQSIYSNVAVEISKPKLKLLGLEEGDFSDVEVTDEVKMWCTVNNLSESLERRGVKRGDRILVFQSLRPTREKLESDISKHFSKYQLLDQGGPFVGVLTN